MSTPSARPITSPSTSVVLRWVVGGVLAAAVSAWLLWWACFVWRPRNLRRIQYRFPRGHAERIQTGDLFLARFESPCSMRDRALRTLTGPGWTHVGLFHRDLTTHELHVVDFGERGVEYARLDEKLQRYAGHIGVRRLRAPHRLSRARLADVQRYVDALMRGHNRTMAQHGRAAISVGSADPAHFRAARIVFGADGDVEDATQAVNHHRAGTGLGMFWEACVSGPNDLQESAICTDFVRMLLQRFDILPRERFKTCTHPSFFATDATVNATYDAPELLKHYETEHDGSLDTCTDTGVHYLDLDGNRLEEAGGAGAATA